MKITQTIELDDKERSTIQNFLKITDDISNIVGCDLEDVFNYFVDKADITDDNEFRISTLHQISDIYS